MSVLTHRNFRLVWTGQIVSVIGDGMRTMALLWLAKTQSGSNAVVVAVAAAAAIPVVLASPLGGWAADRFDRRRLMVGADLHRAAMSALIAAMLFTGHLSTVWLCSLVALAALGTAVFEPTFAATLPTLVPADERAGANGLSMANSAAGGLLGPLAGGALLVVVGPEWVLAIDAVSFVWSAGLIALATIAAPVGAAAAASDDGLSVGVRSVLADRGVRRLAGLASVLNLIAAPMGILIVALAVDRHRVGPGVFGVLEMTVPAGVLVGAVLAARFAGRRSALLVSLLGVGGAIALTGVTPLVVAMAVLVVCGFALAVANTVLITTLQDVVPPEVQGRAFGILGSITQGLRPVGLLLAGPLLAVAGVEWSFVLVGLSVMVAALAWARPATRVRETADEAASTVAVPVGPEFSAS